MMDYLLLLLVKKMLKCSATHGNICLGAFAGAFLTCMTIVLPVPYAFLKFVMFHIAVNTVMIRIGLKIKHIRNFAKAWILLYTGGFLLGGVMEYLNQYVKTGSLFFAAAAAGYAVTAGIWNFIAGIHRTDRYRCKVDLYLGEHVYRVTGMIDTGNGLRDPLTNRPVSILDRKTAGEFFGNEKPGGIRYIPYCSIGKKEGVIPAVKIDKMCVHREDAVWIQKPLIGISEEEIAAGGAYKMILNPDLF